MPGIPQGGPVRCSSTVLRLLPPPSHETFKLLRLPAALRLISPYLLTGSLTWPAAPPPLAYLKAGLLDFEDNGCGYIFFFVFFLLELFPDGYIRNGAELNWKRWDGKGWRSGRGILPLRMLYRVVPLNSTVWDMGKNATGKRNGKGKREGRLFVARNENDDAS